MDKTSFALSLVVGLLVSTASQAEHQFKGLLSCYGDIESYSHKSPSSYQKWEEVKIGAGANVTAGTVERQLLILPADNNGRGFFVVTDDGMYWHNIKRRPTPGGKVIRYRFDLTAFLREKQILATDERPVRVEYPDLLKADGSEYDNRSIKITHDSEAPFAYQPIAPPDAISPDAEKSLREDLIARINDVPRAFRDDQSSTEQRSGKAKARPSSERLKERFLSALRICKRRLDKKADSAVISAIDSAENAITSAGAGALADYGAVHPVKTAPRSGIGE